MSGAFLAASDGGGGGGGIAARLGLELATLDRLPLALRLRYDPASVHVGIVHLGLGNFHRAHQAVYVDDALAAGELDWVICGINLRRRELVDRLRAQDGLYTLRRVLRDSIERRGDARLLGGFDECIACPNTMVDRIVPATVPRDLDEAAAATGLRDDCPVAAERFTQWVVEDRFAAGRPDWARDGVQFVRDVRPFEAMKLRLLNAVHSVLACLGIPAGIATVDEAIAEPRLCAFVERLWREDLVPTLARVDAVLGFEPLFGDLTGNAGLRERARFWHRRLLEHGSLETLR